MRLFSKIAITVALTVAVGTVASAVAVAFVFVPQYLEMDREAALANAERVYDFLQHEADASVTYTSDWGHWDETFKFAKTFDKSFVQRNLKQDDLQTIRVDEFVIARFDRTIAYELRADRSAKAAAVPFGGVKSVPAAHWREFSRKGSRETYAGYAATPAGPAIIASTAISDSNGNGPSPGVVIFVRLADRAFLQSVRETTNVDFTLIPSAKAVRSKGEPAFIGKAKNVPVTLEKHGERIDVDVTLKDVSGQPSFVVRVAMPSRFAPLARNTIWMIVGVLCAIGAAAILVLTVFIRRTVTGPLEQIIGHTKRIAATGDLDKTLGLDRRDEIGALAGAFDRMIGELRQTRLELQEQSFVSGMANTAAEMLHNIRNSLSPITTAIWNGREALKEVKADHLRQAGADLADGDIDQERKDKLSVYLAGSAGHIAERCRMAAAEFEMIHGFTNQIEMVLKDHEELSRGVRRVESVTLPEIADGVRKLAAYMNHPSLEVQISPALERMPAVSAQRVVLRQVMDNLIVNAVQSIERAKPAKGIIALDARDLGSHIELVVTDNGEGITPEHMASLFKRGFTSRAGAGNGLGLHYCATSLGGMKGSIKAESEGFGRGATFRVALPVDEHKERAA